MDPPNYSKNLGLKEIANYDGMKIFVKAPIQTKFQDMDLPSLSLDYGLGNYGWCSGV